MTLPVTLPFILGSDANIVRPIMPFQYSLSGVHFGRGTELPISKVDVIPFNVNIQDSQSPREDSIKFGVDTHAPGGIIFTMAAMDNFGLASMEGLTGHTLNDELLVGLDTELPAIAKVWKQRKLRMTWGAAIPLLFCTRDGSVRRIYGRPGKFGHGVRSNENTMWIDIQAEFRRMDTFAYADVEYYAGDGDGGAISPNGEVMEAQRAEGDGDAWFRCLIQGPATNPVIHYGEETIELNYTIVPGEIVEVSSYPWSRRVINNTSVNLRRKVVGATKYLDQLVFPSETEIDVSWTATGTTVDSKLFFLWRECYNVF